MIDGWATLFQKYWVYYAKWTNFYNFPVIVQPEESLKARQGCSPWLLSRAGVGNVWLYSPWTAEVLQTQLFIPKWEFCSNYLRLVTPENSFAQGFVMGINKTIILFALIFFFVIILVEYFLLLFPLQCCSNILERHLEGLSPLWSLLKTHPAVF